jgi:hypothetical protein
MGSSALVDRRIGKEHAKHTEKIFSLVTAFGLLAQTGRRRKKAQNDC